MKKELASTIAHEINNPLMIISGSAQLALMEEINNKAVEENLIDFRMEFMKDIPLLPLIMKMR